LTIQHLNVPEQREGRDPGLRGDLKWSLKDFRKSLKWMLITILAPEVVIGKSAEDLWNGRVQHLDLKQLAEVDGVPWTFTHTLLAKMGGFVVRVELEENEQEAFKPTETTSKSPDNARATVLPNTKTSKVLPNPFHITASGVKFLREANHLSKLPRITEDEINDKSKSNKFVKAIAITQIVWMIVQVLVRTGKRVAVTQLEISVVAFSVSAIIIYILNWWKPKDVKTPYTLISFSEAIPDDIVNALSDKYNGEFPLSQELGLIGSERGVGGPIPNDFEEPQKGGYIIYIASFSFGCFVFCGIHIGAWNLHFPTAPEAILWRAASIWCTVWPATLLLGILVGVSINNCCGLSYERKDMTRSVGRILVALYAVGRLILLVEIFRTLFFLPPDAFVATLASNIPHVS
jgi:hypothetical protein